MAILYYSGNNKENIERLAKKGFAICKESDLEKCKKSFFGQHILILSKNPRGLQIKDYDFNNLEEFLKKNIKEKRPSWHNYFINISKEVAKRSNCIKRKVGAIIVKENRIISTGYNGTPRGIKNCNEGGCERCNAWVDSGTKGGECICNHAEENAIVQAAYNGISTKDSTIYTTFSPCLACAKKIINAGIKEVYYNANYPLSNKAKDLIKEANILLKKIEWK